MEDRGGKSNSDERCDGEHDLGPTGAQPLRGGDVQYDAGAVGTRTDQQSGREDE